VLTTAAKASLLVLALALPAACVDRQAALALEEAVRAGNATAVERLLSEGVPASAALADGWTPAALAASLGHLDVLITLANAGADLEQVRRVGVERQWTPLGWAAFEGHLDVVAWLIARGVRIDARSSRHQTPLMAAARGGHRDVMARLVAAGADEGATDAAGQTASGMLP